MKQNFSNRKIQVIGFNFLNASLFIKKLCICFIALLFATALNSNVSVRKEDPDLNCSHIIASYCNINLTDTITGLLIDSVYGANSIFYGVANASLKDVLYEKDKQKCDTSYHGGDSCTNDTSALKFAVYYPKTFNGDTIRCNMPSVILFHGGSFFECSSYDNEATRAVCRELAKRGFIAFSVEYRRGVILDPKFASNRLQYLSAQQIMGVYRALQDGRGAIRSIIYMQQNHLKGFDSIFKVDLNNLFIGGFSAGSVIALGSAYYERQSAIDSAYDSVSRFLGPVDAPWYVGGGTLNYKPYIKGVLNLWGGLAIEKSYHNNAVPYFQSNTYNPAMIAFQGKYDSTFPIDEPYIYFSSNLKSTSKYLSENYCLVSGTVFTVPSDVGIDPIDDADAISIGSDSLHRVLKKLGIRTEVYIDCQGRHGLDKDTAGVTYKTEFGTGLLTEAAVYKYIAARAATFFVSIMNNTTGIARSRFIECDNKRVKCNYPAGAASNCGYAASIEDSAKCN